MKKVSCNYLFLLLVSVQVFAQQSVIKAQTVSLGTNNVQASAKPYVPKAVVTEKIETKKTAPADVNIYVLPFFGEYEKTLLQKQKDEEFLQSCDLNFENRQEASKFFTARAWEYLNEGQADTAIYRFNLAWLLNDKNVEPYWGLGVICYQQDKLHDAMNFLEHGHEIDGKNVTLTVDLATVRLQCYLKDNDTEDLAIANKLLSEVIIAEPTFANGYMKFSLLKLVEGKYDEAWGYFHKGYETDINSLDFDLLASLLEKQADPKGKFKK